MTCQVQGLSHTKWHYHDSSYYYHHYYKKNLVGNNAFSSSCFLQKLHNCKSRSLFDGLHVFFFFFLKTCLGFWHKRGWYLNSTGFCVNVETRLVLAITEASNWSQQSTTWHAKCVANLCLGQTGKALWPGGTDWQQGLFSSIMISSQMSESMAIPGN